MHWTPWMKVAFEYFRRTYPEPFVGDGAAEKGRYFYDVCKIFR